jgi:hypothetical protein
VLFGQRSWADLISLWRTIVWKIKTHDSRPEHNADNCLEYIGMSSWSRCFAYRRDFHTEYCRDNLLTVLIFFHLQIGGTTKSDSSCNQCSIAHGTKVSTFSYREWCEICYTLTTLSWSCSIRFLSLRTC